jgi:hypothetical protein
MYTAIKEPLPMALQICKCKEQWQYLPSISKELSNYPNKITVAASNHKKRNKKGLNNPKIGSQGAYKKIA